MTLHAYQSVRRSTMVEGATPHQLTAMLYDGALSNIAIARQHIANDNKTLLHVHVDKAVAIVQELQGSLLDFDTNELASNLFELYRYIVSTLLSAERDMDDEAMGVCANLIEILKDAWNAISPEQLAA